jgi:hypothetical protein
MSCRLCRSKFRISPAVRDGQSWLDTLQSKAVIAAMSTCPLAGVAPPPRNRALANRLSAESKAPDEGLSGTLCKRRGLMSVA